ncbi:MAG TPA: argininosuccinate lyase [Candidatus Binatia bacterium]|nr:argininosuccinate lyase [Candidatus Binatia bacterium]
MPRRATPVKPDSKRRRAARGARKPWGGRFAEATDPAVEEFTSSLAVDLALAPHDIRGSVAHVHALKRARLLSEREAGAIERGLRRVARELATGSFRARAVDEDVHMAVERRLTELVGPVGGKVHTGRSRNDQVATDLRLWLRDEADRLSGAVEALIAALVGRARRDLAVVLPGYTHLQRAQPVLLAHHWLAYVEMLERDRGRLADARRRANVLPLGAGALAGAGFALDRERVASELGFDGVSRNSLDAVADRDFVAEFLAAAAILAMHLSRLGEEIVLWSSQEFGFVELPDAFATGSSMMPQKKNPDVAELVRGKTGRVYGALVSILTTMKGLPLAYNRDLQEDKPPLFDAAREVRACVDVLARMLPRLRIRADAMGEAAGGFALATELADYLVERGVPFREAHEVVGRVVRHCADAGRALESLTAAELRAFSPLLDAGARRRLSPEAAIARRRSTGGTARAQVERRLAELAAPGRSPRSRRRARATRRR